VKENLLFHARLHSVEPKRVEEVIEAVGLTRRARDVLSELSRGMVQRAAVARAVLHDPALLLLDEPRSHLDPEAARALEPLIGSASGRTRVLVSHDVDRTLDECDLALGLRGGRQQFAGRASAGQVQELYA